MEFLSISCSENTRDMYIEMAVEQWGKRRRKGGG